MNVEQIKEGSDALEFPDYLDYVFQIRVYQVHPCAGMYDVKSIYHLTCNEHSI